MKKIIIILMFANILWSVNAQIPTTGLVAFYPFNGNANDTTGNGHNGTVHGATLTTDKFGNPNSAYYFDGSSWIDVPYSNQLNLTGDKTISAWIYISTSDNASLPNAPTIVSKSSTTNYYPTYSLQLLTYSSYGSNQYKYDFFFGDSTSTTNHSCNSTQLYTNYLNQWVCVVGTYIRETGISRIYIDGTLSDSLVLGHMATANSIANDLFIGEAGIVTQCRFVGKIDEVAIYSRCLSKTEVRELCDENVGINETPANNNYIHVYPNPAFNSLILETQQPSTIEILNIQGQTILQQQIQQGKTDIDISGIAKGVYILRLNSNDKTEVIKIVKE